MAQLFGYRSLVLCSALAWAALGSGCVISINEPSQPRVKSRSSKPDRNEDAGMTASTCGGIAALSCDDNHFCNYEAQDNGFGCEDAMPDVAGGCQLLPAGCTREYRPVCGCDRHSYSNRCVAHQAGVSAMREDLCTDLDCEAIDGEVVLGAGPPPACDEGQESAGPVRLSSGAIPTEGAICCVKP